MKTYVQADYISKLGKNIVKNLLNKNNGKTWLEFSSNLPMKVSWVT